MKKKTQQNKNKTRLDNQIHGVIRDMRAVFRVATGPRLRIAYWRANDITSCGTRADWEYKLTVDDVITRRIPSRVAGRVAQAKVFCKCAAARGIECCVVCCADYYDWLDAARGADVKIHGRILMAMMVNGQLRLFDALAGPWPVWYECAVRPGNFVKALRFQLPYMICAIVPGAEFAQCDTYQKMHNLYASGDMTCPDFTIRPDV